MEFEKFLGDEISELQSLLDDCRSGLSTHFAKATNLVADALASGGKLLLAGNGGSAAEAQHMAAEYVATLNRADLRKGFPAISLSTDTSFLTAWSNDFGYDNIFARQLQVLGQAGDVLMAYSTSGSSISILNAIEEARRIGMRSVGFTGARGAAMAELCDVCFVVPSAKTQRIQEVHTLLGHSLCGVVEKRIGTFGAL